MKKSIFNLLLISSLLMIHLGVAKGQFMLELRGGAAFPTQELGEANLNTGFGFEGIVGYEFWHGLGGYAGWSWTRFTSDEYFVQAETDIEETGYMFGLQFAQPIGESIFGYYVRAGGIYNHLEIENEDGDIVDDSDHGLGWQASAGLDINLGSNWMIRPGVKFQALTRELGQEKSPNDVDLNYISTTVGVVKKF